MRWLVFAAGLLLVPGGPAQAHIVGSRLGDFYGGALHSLTGLPDLVLWLALGLLAALQPTRWSRWLLVVFPVGLSLGFAVGVWDGWTPDSLGVDAGLMVMLGGLTAAAVRLPGPALLVLAGLVAAYRGLANASGVETGTDEVLFAAGLVGAGYAATALAVAGLTAFRDRAGWAGIAIRAGGSWIAAIGLMVGGFAVAG